MSTKISPGVICRRRVESPLNLEYFVYLPKSGIRQQQVLVTVHGISRNAQEHIAGFQAQAEHYGVAIIAPYLPAEDFPRYQQLGPSATGVRSDLAFDRMLQDATEVLGFDPAPLRLFGFSGGGQFAHRYALFYPQRVARMVLGAPGWYTFPDPDQRYPYGLRSADDWPKLRFSPARFLVIPTLVLVGEQDDLRDDDLNKSRQIDATQGLNRVDRGERWVNAMQSLARAYNVPSDVQFSTVSGASHAYESYLAHPPFAEQIFHFLFSRTDSL